MLRSAIRRVMRVARATVFMAGLAVILAVLLGVATTALGGTGVGALFHLGKKNTVNATSRLVGSVNGAVLRVDNNSRGARAAALSLRVTQGKPPMKVNSSTKVANLNADKLDGKDASSFAENLWAVVTLNANHSITVTRSKGVTEASKLGTGVYKIQFNRDVSGCAYSATIDQSFPGFISGVVGPFFATEREVVVSTYDPDGNDADRPFHLVVFC
jgi:hypothetical protein